VSELAVGKLTVTILNISLGDILTVNGALSNGYRKGPWLSLLKFFTIPGPNAGQNPIPFKF